MHGARGPHLTRTERPVIIPIDEENGKITLEQVDFDIPDYIRDKSEGQWTTFDENSRLGDLLSNEAAADVLEKHLPGISTTPVTKMGEALTLKQLGNIPQANLSNEKIMAILTDMARIKG